MLQIASNMILKNVSSNLDFNQSIEFAMFCRYPKKVSIYHETR